MSRMITDDDLETFALVHSNQLDLCTVPELVDLYRKLGEPDTLPGYRAKIRDYLTGEYHKALAIGRVDAAHWNPKQLEGD